MRSILGMPSDEMPVSLASGRYMKRRKINADIG